MAGAVGMDSVDISVSDFHRSQHGSKTVGASVSGKTSRGVSTQGEIFARSHGFISRILATPLPEPSSGPFIYSTNIR